MFIFGLRFLSLGKFLTRFFYSTILASTGVLWGIVPEIYYHSPRIAFTFSAYTQDISDQQVMNYARAVLKIESNRRQAYQNIQQILGKKPPEIACNRRESFNNLPIEVQKIAVNHCNISIRIVENSGLTRTQFNDITRRIRTDAVLEQRVKNAILRLQKEQK